MRRSSLEQGIISCNQAISVEILWLSRMAPRWGSHGQRLQKTVDFTSRGDDGMYHQSALERFLRLNVRRGWDGVGLQWLRWWQCWKGEIFDILFIWDESNCSTYISSELKSLSSKHAHFVLYRWSLCEKNDAKLKIFGPHGSDNLLLSTGCFFPNFKQSPLSTFKMMRISCVLFFMMFKRDTHGKLFIVGHVTTLGCRTNSGQFVFMIVIINWCMVGFFHKMTCTSFSTVVFDESLYFGQPIHSGYQMLHQLLLVFRYLSTCKTNSIPFPAGVFPTNTGFWQRNRYSCAFFCWLCPFCLRHEAATKKQGNPRWYNFIYALWWRSLPKRLHLVGNKEPE